MSDESEWDELDQTSVRKGLRKFIADMPEDRNEDRVQALRRLREIVSEEIIQGYQTIFSGTLTFEYKDTLADARKVVEMLSRDLAMLGLAIKHPRTAEPTWLTVAPTPPRGDESWFQLEPVDPSRGTRPERLMRPVLSLKLCEFPPQQPGRGKQPPMR